MRLPVLQDLSSREMGGEDLGTAGTAASRAQSKVTLTELLDTLRLLEEEPELLPPPKLFKKEKYAWIDGVSSVRWDCLLLGLSTEEEAAYWGALGALGAASTSPGTSGARRPPQAAPSAPQEPGSNSLTADNLEKLGKLNHSPGVPEDGALLSEAKLQSIISFLDEMEKSEQERPRSAASATQREVGAEHRGAETPLGRGSPFFFQSLGALQLLSLLFYFFFLSPHPRGCSPRRSWRTWSKRPLLPRR